MKSQNKAYLFAGLAILAWSTIATAFKITLRYVSFVELLLYASLTSTLFFTIYLIINKRLRNVFDRPHKELLRLAFNGILNPFLYYLILLKAYELLPAQEAGTLNYFWPVVLVLLSIPMLGQKISWMSIISVFISFIGIVIISTHGKPWLMQFSNPLGVVLALTCPFIWAIYWILNMKIAGDEVEKLFIGFLSGTILIIIYSAIKHSLTFPPINGLAGAIYVGIFEMGLTFIFWLKALKYSKTTAHISNLVFLSPFLSLFYINFILKERIMLSTITGLILVVVGIIMQQYVPDIEKKGRKAQ